MEYDIPFTGPDSSYRRSAFALFTASGHQNSRGGAKFGADRIMK
jgi:hypothetical protein